MEGISLNLKNPIGDAISRVQFAPRSNNLLISSWDSTLRLYDVDASVLRLESSCKEALLSCCFQEESVAFSVDTSCCLQRYDLCSGTQHTIGNHDDLATCIEYSESNQIVTAGLDKKISFWDVRSASGSSRHTEMVGTEVECISLCKLQLLIAAGTTVYLYDLRNLRGPVETKDRCMDYTITCISSFADCQGYAVGSVDGRVALMGLNPFGADEMGCVFQCHPKKLKDENSYLVAVNDIKFHPSYGTFVTGDNEGRVIIWDGQSRKKLFAFSRFPSSVASCSYNCDGQFLAVAASFTMQEANEVNNTKPTCVFSFKEEAPQVFVHQIDERFVKPFSGECSSATR